MESVSFARRFDNVTGSAIREIFKVLGRPGMISFAGGNPSLDALPDKLCAELARDALLADGQAHFAVRRHGGLSALSGKPVRIPQEPLWFFHGWRRRASHHRQHQRHGPAAQGAGQSRRRSAGGKPDLPWQHADHAPLRGQPHPHRERRGRRAAGPAGGGRAQVSSQAVLRDPHLPESLRPHAGRRPAETHRGAGRQIRLHRGRG